MEDEVASLRVEVTPRRVEREPERLGHLLPAVHAHLGPGHRTCRSGPAGIGTLEEAMPDVLPVPDAAVCLGSEEVAVITDIHANLPALEAALARMLEQTGLGERADEGGER